MKDMGSSLVFYWVVTVREAKPSSAVGKANTDLSRVTNVSFRPNPSQHCNCLSSAWRLYFIFLLYLVS